MKRHTIIVFAIILLAASLLYGAEDATPSVTVEDLGKIKTPQGKDLPLKPQEILDLTDSVALKKSTISIKTNQYAIKINPKDRDKYAKKKTGLVRICADVYEKGEKDVKPKMVLTGRANILLLDLENSKVVLNVSESLARLCPT